MTTENIRAARVVVSTADEGPMTWAMGSLFERLAGPDDTDGLLGLSLVT
jgi:hypothetical protein